MMDKPLAIEYHKKEDALLMKYLSALIMTSLSIVGKESEQNQEIP